jgi:hypothetical protein
MTPATRSAIMAPPKPVLDNLLYRFTVEQYHKLMNADVLHSGDRVELLEGLLARKMTIHPPHAVTVGLIQAMLHTRLPGGWIVRIQQPITLADSEPEPDAVVARGTLLTYADHHPGPADVPLVIEVSDSTLGEDRGLKQRIYARARIAVYWIVNLPERQIEVYTQPRAGKSPTYRQCQVIAPPDSVSVTIGATVVGPIPVADLLPPVSPA